MSAFTKGPWRWDKDETRVYNKNGDEIAHIDRWEILTDDYVNEVGLMVQAAPDMYEALEDVLNSIELMHEADADMTGKCEKDVYDALDRAKAALAKARGE